MSFPQTLLKRLPAGGLFNVWCFYMSHNHFYVPDKTTGE